MSFLSKTMENHCDSQFAVLKASIDLYFQRKIMMEILKSSRLRAFKKINLKNIKII